MLEIRTNCENCNKALPNESGEAMICTYECAFCKDCVEQVLQNVCPNCGRGFEKRRTRPTKCITLNCLQNDPVSTKKIFKPVDQEKFKLIYDKNVKVDPRKR